SLTLPTIPWWLVVYSVSISAFEILVQILWRLPGSRHCCRCLTPPPSCSISLAAGPRSERRSEPNSSSAHEYASHGVAAPGTTPQRPSTAALLDLPTAPARSGEHT